MKDIHISDNIKFIGVNDYDLDLFESQYIIPNGVSYNSYLIIDEKVVVMDTIDKRKTDEWFLLLEKELGDRKPDYLVVSHMEPDHGANIKKFIEKHPNATIVGNKKTFCMINQFFNLDEGIKKMVVKEGDELSLGEHTLKFYFAPMIHWPEVMFTFEKKEGLLFSADAFGKFGTLDIEDEWDCEARRYYFNIVGKYGQQVQCVLKKISNLDIKMICPLHGPILKNNLGYYIDKYHVWSSYTPEDDGVLVAYASIHGNTKEAAFCMEKILKEMNAKKVVLADLTRDDMAEIVEDAFRYDKMILMSATYDGGLFPCMEDFLHHLKAKAYQNRKVALVENGSWVPMAAKKMSEIIQTMKNIDLIDEKVTILSSLKDKNIEEMKNIAKRILQ